MPGFPKLIALSVLGPIPFKIFTGDTDSGIERALSKFAGDPKASGAVGILEGRDGTQGDCDRREERARANLAKCSKAKRKVPHLRWGNLQYQYRLRGINRVRAARWRRSRG